MRHYVATRQEIAARYAEYEITGQAKIRDVDPDARSDAISAFLRVDT